MLLKQACLLSGHEGTNLGWDREQASRFGPGGDQGGIERINDAQAPCSVSPVCRVTLGIRLVSGIVTISGLHMEPRRRHGHQLDYGRVE